MGKIDEQQMRKLRRLAIEDLEPRQLLSADGFEFVLIGDSTVNSGDPNSPIVGWGEVLTDHVDGLVDNRAVSGSSSQTFFEQYWDPINGVRDSLDPNDVVLIQFGINDPYKPAPGMTETEFKDQLQTFIVETRSTGALPILVTSPGGFAYWPQDDFDQARYTGGNRGAWTGYTREVASATETPLIDLFSFSVEQYSSRDIKTAWSTYIADQSPGSNYDRWLSDPTCAPPSAASCVVDKTHPGMTGATIWAQFVGQELNAILATEPPTTEPPTTGPPITDPPAPGSTIGEGLDFVLVGDATVTSDPLTPTVGWGEVLQSYVAGDVHNHAEGGSSSKTFYDQHWSPSSGVRNTLDTNDVVLIQFGINDPYKPGSGMTEAQYKDQLTDYIEETRAVGATPILVTSPAGFAYWPQNDLELATYNGGNRGAWPQYTRDVASATGVPLIDLFKFSSGEYSSQNILDVWSTYVADQTTDSDYDRWLSDPTCAKPSGTTCPVDRTNTGHDGANIWADFVAQELGSILASEPPTTEPPTTEPPTTEPPTTEPPTTEPPTTEPPTTEPPTTEPPTTPGNGLDFVLIGDTTVNSGDSSTAIVGWGEVLSNYVAGDVLNQAREASSSQTFYDQYWRTSDGVRLSLNTDDVVLIQFGINDPYKPNGGMTESEYKTQLTLYIEETQSAGATPVLVTSPAGFAYWPSSDPQTASYSGGNRGVWPQYTRDVATATGTPLIDLFAFSFDQYSQTDILETWSVYVADQSPDSNYTQWLSDPTCAPPAGATCAIDRTHTGAAGANIWARYVAEELATILHNPATTPEPPTTEPPTNRKLTDEVQAFYRNRSPQTNTSVIDAQISVENVLSTPQNFKGYEVRYYFDADRLTPITTLRQSNAPGLASGYSQTGGYAKFRVTTDFIVQAGERLDLRFEITNQAQDEFRQTNDASYIASQTTLLPTSQIDVFATLRDSQPTAAFATQTATL